MRLARNGMIALFVPEGLGLHDHPITVVERVRSMRRAGESVAMFATKSGDRLITQDPMWKYSLHRLACLFDGRANVREIYWELILGAAFTWGYIRESFR